MSHFTKINTKLRDLDTLKKTLSDLNIEWTNQTNTIRGYKVAKTSASLVIPQQNSYDIGFKWNGKEYDLVTDLAFWSQNVSLDTFLNRINQRYAYNMVLDVSEKEGFNFSKVETSADGSLRVVLNRFVN